MPITALERKMLYCPKCSSSYQEGTQRFCTNDGSRLVTSSSSTKTTSTSQGIFSSLLEKRGASYENDEKVVPRNKPVQPPLKPLQPPTVRTENPVFRPNLSSKVFKEETPVEQKQQVKQSFPPQKTTTPIKPAVRLIKPNEIASGTAEIGNRVTNPTGRLALTWENPKVMLGQTVKGRYYVTKLIGKDDISITFLAEDKIIAQKEVIVRILMEEKNDDFLSKIFADERVTLSHINHPNIVKVLDSGELLEGKPFVVTERVDGFSLREKLNKLENFNPLRTARVIRQASYALSEVHQNGILHRSLKPDSIYLTVSEVGAELVKVTDFVVANGAKKQNLENAKYLSPEQLEGKMPNFASDVYSLAVIAYQLLTGKMPFGFASADQLYRAQKEGLKVLPTDLRNDISQNVDEVFVKALSYNPNDRYPKSRDFGDALFHSLNNYEATEEVLEQEEIFQTTEVKKAEKLHLPSNSILISSLKEKEQKEANTITVEAKAQLQSNSETNISSVDSGDFKSSSVIKGESNWEKRSPEPIQTGNFLNYLIYGLGLLILLVATAGILKYYSTRQPAPDYVPSTSENSVDPNQVRNTITDATTQFESPTPTDIETPPLPRSITPPPNSQYFENSKLDLKGDLAKNYLGFKLHYPNDWTKEQSSTHFVDVSKKAPSGTPIEQFLVTYYESKGTFTADSASFPNLVEKSNKQLAGIITNYKYLSGGEKTINEGWRGYEMMFQGEGVTNKGEKIAVWGRRLFIPPARPGVKTGFVITMLATSLSPVVKGAEDVGVKGDLGSILYTFEPSTMD